VKFSFRIGKRFGFSGLTDEQQAVVERLERGEIMEAEAERLLGGEARVVEWKIDASSDERETGDEPPLDPDDAKAREMIERIAREVDAETGG
jgi:hypothetical protein